MKRLARVHDELAAVNGRMDRLAGRIYAQTRKPSSSEPVSNGDTAALELEELDPELAAELRLQTAAPVSPGTRN